MNNSFNEDNVGKRTHKIVEQILAPGLRLHAVESGLNSKVDKTAHFRRYDRDATNQGLNPGDMLHKRRKTEEDERVRVRG